jgi:hypothetical protein
MRTDLSGQIHELMERGLRPVGMADIQSRAPERVSILRRAAARSGPGHRRFILAGAAGIAASVAVALAFILPGSTGHTGSSGEFAAWTVVKQPGGSVMVTLHEVRDPARLQRTLRADGIPAHVYVAGHKDPGTGIPGCHVYPPGVPGGTSFSLWRRVFFGPHTKVTTYDFWVYPSAIPSGFGVGITILVGPSKLSNNPRDQHPGADAGYGVNGIGLSLVKATPRCTGS